MIGWNSGACTVPNTVMRSVCARSPVAQVMVSSDSPCMSVVAAVALPAADRQDEVDAGLVGHLRERKAILPARRPALRHLGRRAARRAVDAEQAELQRVGVVHLEARALGRCGAVEQDGSSRLLLEGKIAGCDDRSTTVLQSCPVSRAQRSTKRSDVVRCRTRTVSKAVSGTVPRSAVHRSASLRAAPHPGHAAAKRSALRTRLPSRGGCGRRYRSGRTPRPTISAARLPSRRA